MTQMNLWSIKLTYLLLNTVCVCVCVCVCVSQWLVWGGKRVALSRKNIINFSFFVNETNAAKIFVITTGIFFLYANRQIVCASN